MDQPLDTVSKALVESNPHAVAQLLLGWIGYEGRVLRARPDRTELTRVAEPIDNLLRVEVKRRGKVLTGWLLLEVMAEWKTGYERTVRNHWENARRKRKTPVPVVLVLMKGHGRTTMHPRETLESGVFGIMVEHFRFFVVKLWTSPRTISLPVARWWPFRSCRLRRAHPRRRFGLGWRSSGPRVVRRRAATTCS